MLHFLQRSFLGLVLLCAGIAAQVRFDCDPCIERDGYKIRAIVHGSDSDPFWLQIQAAMVQAAKDMKVQLSMQFAGDDNTSDMDRVYRRMASAITSAAKSSDVLLVTIPDPLVQTAVEEVIRGGTPVFGLESGYDVAKIAGLRSFVGMDDELGGKSASEYVLESGATINRALFVEDASATANKQAQARRQKGFASALSNGENASGANVETMVVTDASTFGGTLEPSLAGCPYDLILLGTHTDEMVDQTLAALEAKGCADTMLGTFGTSVAIHQAVSAGKLKFAVGQQPYLQGALSLVHAALYVSTGKSLAPSSESEYGMVLSGPELITQETAVTDTFQVCEADAFPVCPNGMALDGVTKSRCDCAARSKTKLAGVLHAVTTDSFWDIVYTAANQAADDFGVELELDRMEPDTADVLHLKMATQIQKHCQEGIDGIFVTIPSEAVLEAIGLCQKLNVPVVSINAGPDFSHDLGLQHHLGMVEFNAGYLAGQQMLEKASITKAICTDHAPGNIVLIDRCGGFQKAMEEGNVEYLGAVTVPDDNAQLHVSNVETFIKEKNGDSWSGLGVLLGGGPQHQPGVLLKDAHPEIVMGTFDTSDDFYEGIDAGKFLFGMDQGPYLQGYLPIPLLTWQAQTMQSSINHLIESGPDFVFGSPSQAQQTCELEHFKSCDWVAVSEGTALGSDIAPESSGGGGNEAAIISLSIVALVCLFSIAFLAYRMHLLKNYVHRLEEQGQSPPRLTTGDYITSAYMPVEKIVNDRTETADPSASEPC